MPTHPADGQNPTFVRDATLTLLWLLVLALVNQATTTTVYSIFPYLLPVVFLGWRHGAGWGFGAAALATLAAVPAGYPAQHADVLIWAAGSTYLKLSCAVAGACLGRSVARSPA
ncbi:MAG: hypothetical protein AB7I04_01635 [Pseudomonadales bacterium]